jgi:hypothetical protein
MSGIDEQKPELVCPQCGNHIFEKTSYGYKKSRARTDAYNNEVRVYESGWFEDDSDGWQCTSCFYKITSELRAILDEKILEM